ncbi:tetratricopeptide repeat protein [uncultured Erythrobacter sp.]|uniref:tetratricopeptide repeat protein n=1 Tax=uncultured Erythrobacter sp. TaxID=263913 RepID=UPI00261956DC|nr:tetratricopeptide repeat protein [uncultured Erythrobacter sp.]
MDNLPAARLKSLTQFLETDPENPALLRDVAETALEANECDLAVSVFARLHGIEPLEGALANLAGIASMRAGDQKTAGEWYAVAAKEMSDDDGLRFNQAWSLALSGDFSASAELLSDDVTKALPQAAMLDMQIAHELGEFEDAEAKMDAYVALHPDYPPLQAAASVLAMDVDRPDLAREAALKGGSHPDAVTTLGTLNLGDFKVDEAQAQFEQALATGHKNPRAEIGLGLVALARQDYTGAANSIDKGAEQFGDHLGSWIAAGWSYLLAGDMEKARERFQKAFDADDTFGEAQGSLAVMDILEGDVEEGQRKTKVALRLNRQSFSASLAGILLANANDDTNTAKQIFERALQTSVLPGGVSLEQAIVQSMAVGTTTN